MATLEQIANALRNADAAGDVEAARRLAAAYRQLQSQTPREQAGFGESFKEAFTSLKAAPAAARFAAAQTPEEQRAAREELLAASEGAGAPRTAFADIEDFGSALDWAKQTIGASAGFLAAPLAAGAAGLAAGPVGGAVGLYGTLASQYTTQNLVRQAEEQAKAEEEGRVAEETSVGKAVTAAGAATALDAVGFRFFRPIFNKFPLVGKMFGQGDEAAKEATDRIIAAHKNGSLTIKGGVAKGVVGGAVFEVPQEIAQTALERWQAGLSLFDADAKSEYIEAAAGGALIGAGLGGAGGAAQVRADRRRAEEALAEKDRIEQEEAEAQRKAEVEAADVTEEKKPVPPTKGVATEEELTQAQTILGTLEADQEVKPLDFERALIEGGIPKNRARRVIRSLKTNKLLEEDKETGLFKFVPPVEVPAYTAPEGADEFVEEGVEAPTVEAPPTEVAAGEIEGEPTGIVTSEAVTQPSGAGVGLPIQREGAERPSAAEVGGAGVVSAGVDTERADVGEEVPQPALTKKQRSQQEVAQAKEQRKTQLDELTVKLNNLRTILPEQVDEETVAEILSLTAKLEGTFEALNKLPKNKTAKYSEKESKLDGEIVALRNELNFLTDLAAEQTQPFKSREELQAELKDTEAEAQRRAAREVAGGLSATEKALPVTAQFEAELRKGVDNAINFVSRKADERLTELRQEPGKSLLAAQKRKPVEAEEALVDEIATEIARKTAKPSIGGRGRIEKEDQRQAEINTVEVLSGLTETLNRVSFRDSAVQIEGDANANPEVFGRLRRENKLAEYDPRSNTFYFTRDGLSRRVVLHEAVHAATVKVLRAFETDPASLSKTQREAAEHIVKIYEAAKQKLGGRYPNEFENVYEFVSGVATSNKLQRELANITRPSLAKYTKKLTDLWSQFTEALAKMFGIDSRRGTKPRVLAGEDKLPGISGILPGEKGYRGNLLLESSEALKKILANPEKGVDVEPLPARKRRPRGRRAAPADTRTAEQVLKATDKERQKYSKRTLMDSLRTFFSGSEGYEEAVRKLQNDRRDLLTLQEQLRRSGKLQTIGPKANNLYDLIALSSGKAFQALTQFIKRHTDDANRAIAAYAKARGLSVDDAVKRLSMYLTAKHEPERREVKYVMNVPLNDTTKIGSKTLGRTDTAAGHRRFIVEQLNNNFAAEKKKLGRDLTDAERESLAKSYRNVLNQLVAAYTDKDGFTPTGAKPGTMPLNKDAPEYRVIGKFSEDVLQEIRDKYQADLADPTVGPMLEQMVKSLETIQDETIRLNREADYWSPPVDNFKNFYGYQNYVTFKGRPDSQVSAGDERFELDGKRSGSDYMDIAGITEGRQSESDNVILTTLADGAKAAMRNGRIGVTQAIKNLINEKNISGRLVKTIKFEDRYKEGNRPEDIRKQNRVFHYLPDGTIEVYAVNDQRINNAIRRTYEADNPLLDLANKVTSGIGQLHTRYNPAFYPYNFVRDALTNAFTMGAELGPKASLEYIGAVAAQIGKMGMVKTGRVAKMYAEGRIDELRAKAKKDIDVRNILEYLEEGGRVSYVQGLALQGQMDSLLQEIGKKGFSARKEALDKWVDIWADSFEFTSRAAAYSVAKNNALARGLSEAEAKREAAAYAKNIANFEQIGEWGKGAGALFMFFRPAATGAVRAFDAIAPLFQDLDKAVRMLPAGVRNDPAAVANFRKNFLEQRENAKAMIYGLLGAGATLYLMAYMAADEDELGRNRVATDDMALWTRNLRLPLGFMGAEEKFLQIPWGFGLGAFGAAGAQVMGLAVGETNLKDTAVNMFTIGLDSFMPLPFSRINPLEEPTAWFVDSILPSAVRPFVQFTMNVDGLGRDIYLNRATKYGEAFTGGRGVPDLYKDMARTMFEITNGEVDVQPNTLYFWTNNYLDGISRIGQSLYGAGLSVTGQKDFDPKEDLLIFRSYIGRKTNFDAREFAAVERKIEEKRKTLNALENLAELSGDPTQLYRYLEKHPNDPMIVDIYNKEINREIKQVRQDRNSVMVDPNLTRQQRNEILDQIDLYQNMLKRGLIETFRQYNVEP